MRIVVFLAFILCASTSFANEESEKKAAAERYLAATPMSDMLSDMAGNMAMQIPEAERDDFIRLMTTEVDVSKLESAALDAMVKTFTLEELNALADFYGSDVGKSAMGKFGTYMAMVMPAIQREIMRAVSEMQ
ncbi:DUF2059 domain-containing protein [Marinobacter daepoensis]|uniref:DUF2059 domain-containing protein n=1 Tax=Marinobacter daepoensis TaxID=262077 RepID=A0ABS3BCT6_9GAMM|nr:DUF2059 domain-containing protein [Marinobacter daepoensis]MBN7769297.1 DUF2059 domain-containing protein [Marinobacter daepoensis]MBY6032042.1 DUF2059 domain-containing protein [Marinobacter daepoensis]MBY6077987.1 DUF2059 domain-containing protein [Marinobacter daepoensis]